MSLIVLGDTNFRTDVSFKKLCLDFLFKNFAVINFFCIMIDGISRKWSLISQTKLSIIGTYSRSI